MNALFNKIAIVLTVAAASTSLHAQQVRTAAFGRTTLQFSSTFLSTVSSLGGSVQDLALNPLPSTGISLPVTTGAFNPTTAVGEIEHTSGFTLVGGGKTIRLENFIIDTTNAAAPFVSAVFVFNDTVLGRVPLFNVQYPSGISLPLPTTAGVLQVTGLKLTLSATGASTLNSIFGINVIPANLDSGTASVYVVLAPRADGTL